MMGAADWFGWVAVFSLLGVTAIRQDARARFIPTEPCHSESGRHGLSRDGHRERTPVETLFTLLEERRLEFAERLSKPREVSRGCSVFADLLLQIRHVLSEALVLFLRAVSE